MGNDDFNFQIGFAIGNSLLNNNISKSRNQVLDVFSPKNTIKKNRSQSTYNIPSQDILNKQINPTKIKSSSDAIINNKKIQIFEYYTFHKKIENIFKIGYNPFFLEKSINSLEEIYIIDRDWINLWKNYSNYNKVKPYFDNSDATKEEELMNEMEEMFRNMIMTEEINNKGVCPPSMDNEKTGNHFCSKLILNLEDFDCIINKKNYESFKRCYGCKTEAIKIRTFINDTIIILIFDNMLKIKFIYFEKNIMKVTADFVPNISYDIEYREILKLFVNM